MQILEAEELPQGIEGIKGLAEILSTAGPSETSQCQHNCHEIRDFLKQTVSDTTQTIPDENLHFNSHFVQKRFWQLKVQSYIAECISEMVAAELFSARYRFFLSHII